MQATSLNQLPIAKSTAKGLHLKIPPNAKLVVNGSRAVIVMADGRESIFNLSWLVGRKNTPKIGAAAQTITKGTAVKTKLIVGSDKHSSDARVSKEMVSEAAMNSSPLLKTDQTRKTSLQTTRPKHKRYSELGTKGKIASTKPTVQEQTAVVAENRCEDYVIKNEKPIVNNISNSIYEEAPTDMQYPHAVKLEIDEDAMINEDVVSTSMSIVNTVIKTEDPLINGIVNSFGENAPAGVQNSHARELVTEKDTMIRDDVAYTALLLLTSAVINPSVQRQEDDQVVANAEEKLPRCINLVNITSLKPNDLLDRKISNPVVDVFHNAEENYVKHGETGKPGLFKENEIHNEAEEIKATASISTLFVKSKETHISKFNSSGSHNTNMCLIYQPAFLDHDYVQSPIFTTQYQCKFAAGNLKVVNELPSLDKPENKISEAHPEKRAKQEIGKRIRKSNESIANEKCRKQLPCPFCNKVLASGKRGQAHLLSHITPKQVIEHNCTYCDKKFTTEKRIQIHLRTHQPKIQNYSMCEVCGQQLKGKSQLKKHLLLHSEVLPHVCEECGAKFSSPDRLKWHADVHQTKLKPNSRKYLCTLCPQQFSLPGTLNRHLRAHKRRFHGKQTVPRGGSKYTCTVCMESFVFLCEIQSHTRYVHPLKDIICSLCQKVVSSWKDLKWHFSSQHAQRYPQPCRRCQMCFPNQWALMHHVRSMHPDLAEFLGYNKPPFKPQSNQARRPTQRSKFKEPLSSCDECGRQFRFKTNLMSHLNCHRNKGNPKQVLECEKCGKVFQTTSNFSNHLRTHQSDDQKISLRKKFFCNMCNRKFTKKAHLTIHVQVAHKNGGLSCPVCKKVISLEDSLRKHMAVHTKESPSCHICGKSCITKQVLNFHLATHKATGSGDFGCAECGKVFRCRKNLQIHLRIHESDRPKICSYCNVGFVFFSKYCNHNCNITA